LGSLPHASECVAGQTHDDPTTWSCSALTTLKQLHDKLLTHYNCTEWAPPPPAGPAAAPAPAPLPRDATTTVLALFPFLCLTFSLHCVLGRTRKTARTLFVRRYLHNIRSLSGSCNSGRCMSRCCEIRLQARSVTCTCFIAPNRCHCLMSTLPCVAICRNVTTRRAARQHAAPSPLPPQCGARWAALGRQVGRNASRTTEIITEKDYVAFFHQFFGFTNNSALAPFANAQCPCQRYFMGGDGTWDHINSCIHHNANWTTAHEHVLQAFERVCNDAGFATRRKRVLTSAGRRCADLTLTTLLTAPLPTRSATIRTHITAIARWPVYRRACLHRDVSTASSCACSSSSPRSTRPSG
jgi:hypothetical protein